ncbi:MAG: DNA-directed RNA polymerase subunit alpha, partial [Nitrospirae bacterium]|nr:DNA-directed RNA polymerase subunit alpha [Nitrospirota bacterium]
PSDVEVLNKDGYIATVDAGATFEMEIYVKKGRGYQPAETYKEKGLPLDVLYVDAVFSPIKKVNFLVEKTRVGRFTDYDKLIMDVWTDGSVSPQKAVSSASAILNDHFRLFIDETDEMAEHEEKAETAVVDPIDPSMNKNLLKNIEEIDITVRAYNCLKNANIKTVADLVQKTELDILRTKNFGQKSLDEIRDVLHSMGLDFGMAIEAADLNKYERESAQLGGRNASQGSRQAIK